MSAASLPVGSLLGELGQTAARRLLQALLGPRLPRYDGEARCVGLHEPVLVRRDAYGVPHVSARSDEDAWFGLGYAMGQDRPGQLEIFVRVVRGTLSEVTGAESLPIDRLSRRIGFRRVAAEQLRASSPAIRAQYEAFARGLNEGRAKGADKLAHDFVLLGCDPSPVIGADLAAISTFLAFALASNWDAELTRLEVLEEEGPEAARLLEASYLPDLPTTDRSSGTLSATHALEADLAALRGLGLVGGGSNAWTVAGDRTKSGRPIVAGDPHMPPALPNLWYLAHAETPVWAAAGAMITGLPGFVSGHNGWAAWGVTAAHGDNTDWFVEEIGEDGASLREGDRFVPCEVRRERIRVKGGPDHVEDVLVGPRGPLVSPALQRGPGGTRKALSLAATWLAPEPYEGFLRTHLVRSAHGLREAFRKNSTSGACIAYADESGEIGFHWSMSVPVRRKGFGTVPLPGWDPEAGWQAERVALERLPFAAGRSGAFVLANHAPTSDTEPFLGADFLDGFRAKVIEDALAARSDWDVASTIDLQRDVRSLPWLELSGAVRALRPTQTAAREAQAILAAWDGRLDAASEGASVFSAFVVELEGRFVRAVAPRSADLVLGQGAHGLLPRTTLVTRRMRHLVRVLREGIRPAGFPPWEVAIEDALAAALERVRARAAAVGSSAWGAARPMVLVHPFGEKGLSAIWNRGPLPGFGDATTVAQGAVDFLDAFANPVGVPVMRMTIPVGDWDDARFALLGGQSGNPLSPHYDDQIEPWTRGGFPLAFTEPAVARATAHTLRLDPA